MSVGFVHDVGIRFVFQLSLWHSDAMWAHRVRVLGPKHLRSIRGKCLELKLRKVYDVKREIGSKVVLGRVTSDTQKKLMIRICPCNTDEMMQ